MARSEHLLEIHKIQQNTGQQPLPSPASDVQLLKSTHTPPTPLPSKARKRKRESEHQLKPSSSKRPRTSCVTPPVQSVDFVTCWTQTYHWPREYFNERGEMNHLLPREESTASLCRKRPDSESNTPASTIPSDQKPREEKSAPYQEPCYRSLLEATGSLMGKYVGRNEESPTAEIARKIISLCSKPSRQLTSIPYFRTISSKTPAR